MSYKVKPQLKLYKFENNSFVLQAIIDDYSEVSFEHNLYQAGTFTISINYNIPNSQLFQRGLFVQFGNNPGDFGEIYSIQDSISKDGKGSQTRTIVGYDARYILKRRVIKNMNSNGLWVMTAKGELCIRNLIKDQCGVDAEEKRRLPIINNIPDVSGAKGKEYSVSEQFTNLYEVCKTIATQSEIGWRISFINNELNLEIYEGEDLSQTVRFDTNYESLANGKFSDSSESFSNAIYIGGKGQNDSRDIYEGENGSPSGFNRFESWDNQSQMTTEDEYETEAISMLSQYGQTLTITGNGLVKCPYVFREQYNVGDIITVAFSGKSAAAQILSVTEHWSFGNYEINFNFGKPQNNLSDQLQLMLRQIQKASETSNSTESVKWYNVANENTMDSADVTYNTIGFTGAMTSNKTFTFYLDNEKTGAKSYNIYAKNLTGNYNLTLTTGRSGKTNVILKGGVNITSRILIDEEGNIISQGMTSTSVVESGNNQPVTSDGVATTLTKYGKIYNNLDALNADKGTSITLENGVDNCSKIVNVLNANEVFSDCFHNYTTTSKWGIGSSSGTSYVLIRFEKLDNNYCRISAYETDTNTEYFRISKVGTLEPWQINAKQTDLNGYMSTKTFSSPGGGVRYVKIEGAYETFGGILLAFDYNTIYFISSTGVLNLSDNEYGLTGVAFSSDKITIWLRITGWRRFSITNLSKSPNNTISDATTTAPSGYTFTANWKQIATKSDLTYKKRTAAGNVGVNISDLTFNELIVEVVTSSNVFVFNILKSMLTTTTKYYRDGYYYNSTTNALCTIGALSTNILLTNLYINGIDEKANATINVHYR